VSVVPGVAFTLLIGFAPAPPEVMDAVQEIEIETSTVEASAFRLRLAMAQTSLGDWTVLERDVFRPLVPVSIRLGNGRGVPETIVNGFVSNVDATFADEAGESVLEVTGLDATSVMNLQEKVMPWPNLPDHAIAAAIFGQYALVPRVQPTPPQLVEPEGTTTQRGTDIRFLRRLADRHGFECYVQPEPLSGVDMGFFQPPTLTGLPQAVLNVSMGPESNVTSFRVRYAAARPTTAVASGLDVMTKAVQPALAPASLQVPLGLEPALTRVLPPPIVRPAGTGLMRTAELQRFVQAIADRSSGAVVAEGQTGPDVGILRPGGLVNVRGAGRLFSGSYHVTQVSHLVSREGHVQRFHAWRNAVTMTGAELFVEV
jgi:phage protein D